VRWATRAGIHIDRPDVRTVPLRTFLAYFLGLGTWGFGGPIATVGYMQRDVVERRNWVSRQDFLDGVALGQTMPGPLAAQVVMWLGTAGRRRCAPSATWAPIRFHPVPGPS
jgi:chromate transport protein ChrA